MGLSSSFLPPLLTSNLRAIHWAVVNDDWDWLIVIYGRERVGKTVLSALGLFTLEPDLWNGILSGIYEPALARFAWDFDNMVDIVKELPKGSAIAYQEARMLGREAMKHWNIRMVTVMSTIGSRNIIFFLTFPRFSMLDPYLRMRARTKIHVRTHHGARGYARCYYRAVDAEDRNDDGMRYAFDTTFRSPEILGEFWHKLQERETEVKLDILRRHGYRRKIAPLDGVTTDDEPVQQSVS